MSRARVPPTADARRSFALSSGKPSRYHRDEHPQAQSQSSFLDKSDAFTVQPTMPHTSMIESPVNATISSPATQCEVEVGVDPRPPVALDTRILSTHRNVCTCGNEDESDVLSRRPVQNTRSRQLLRAVIRNAMSLTQAQAQQRHWTGTS
ncbi:hypothetical protein T440DRAFT_523962 [Plenodomus tracheiphilus IPT5]|uniref:Uncharacterized protein n=1 Tax=Plenodomus tracheiphilus IPT5 TaxID=1408161 RepID=A0A6A7ALP2_9PLEO|nr:hypothetical protein T440DRAFT_523962 [Plenodomus tracheiphilus IPT5]